MRPVHLWAQFHALMYKNFRIALVNWPFSILRILLPSLMVFALFLITLTHRHSNTGRYPEPITLKLRKMDLSEGRTLLFGVENNYNNYNDQRAAYDIMSEVARNNDPPLSIAPYGYNPDEIVDCQYDVCPFGSTDQIIRFLNISMQTFGAVQFDFDIAKQKIRYSVLFNDTFYSTNPFSYNSPYQPVKFLMPIQTAVDGAIANLYGRTGASIETQYVPAPRLNSQSATNAKSRTMVSYGTFALYLCFFLSTIHAHYLINNERGFKLREGMRAMGLWNSMYWSSWFIYHSLFNFLSVVLMVATGAAIGFNLFRHCNPVITFLIFFLLAEALTSFWLLSSTFIRSIRVTNTMSFIQLAIGMGFLVFFTPVASITGKYLGYIIPKAWSIFLMIMFIPFNFAKNLADVVLITDSEKPASFTFHDMYYHAKGPLTLSDGLLIMFGNMLINLVLTWYFDNVLPGEYGSPLPWYYLFTPSYYGFHKGKLAIDVAVHNKNKYHSVLPDTDEDIYGEYQDVIRKLKDVPDDESTPLKIVKLSKTYTKLLRKNNTQALDSLTLSADKGTVLALLGHNGAGKTTCIHMLTGLYTPTSGDALIYGKSITNDMDQIQSIMGVCSQDDILWPELNAEDHLWIFAKLKRVPSKEIKNMIETKIAQVQLQKASKQPSSTLSGGMKRRLSIAISTIGHPKIIFLDEPTSGMDPVNRKFVWNMITEMKKDRVIVLTTHSMQEADALGDKIAILALGRLRAVGSSLHLKNRFGGGYTINLVTDPARMQQLKDKVEQIMPGAKIDSETAGSVSYALRIRKMTPEMKNFFAFIEAETEKYNARGSNYEEALIRDWGVSHTTLEDVFLRITHGGDSFDQLRQESMRSSAGDEDEEGNLQLNIALESNNNNNNNNSADAFAPIGFIDVNATTTLQEARALIRSCIGDSAPAQFVFLSNGIPISAAQEATKRCAAFVPLITIRPVGGGSSSSSSPSSSTAAAARSGNDNDDDDVQHYSVSELQSEVLHLRQDNARLAQRNKELEQMLHEMQQRLALIMQQPPSNSNSNNSNL